MNQAIQTRSAGSANLAQMTEFDEVIDVRTPAEFADDHIPGAINCPVLSDEERAHVGSLYKQVSPFVARKVGAALMLRRIADHLESRFHDRERNWRPLLYCWRGGKRSGGFAHVLRQIGWDACALDGGYKSYRRFVVTALHTLPATLRFRVVCGATGSGKSRVLQALAALGAQVLDLEALAVHKGSVLGDLPDEPQPTQKRFESQLYARLAELDAARAVFVEAESRKIGLLQVPDAMLVAMRESPCVRIDASLAARVRFLVGDYDYFVSDPGLLIRRIERLKTLQSNTTLARWKSLAESGDWATLVEELLTRHYDPLYDRSQDKNYTKYAQAASFAAEDLSPEGITRLARQILAA